MSKERTEQQSMEKQSTRPEISKPTSNKEGQNALYTPPGFGQTRRHRKPRRIGFGFQ